MTTYTRTLSAIAAAALVVAATVSTVAGQPPAGQRPGPGFGRGGPGGPFPVLGQLNLTEDQKAQVKTLLDEERTADRRAVAGPEADGVAAYPRRRSVR